MNIFSVSIRTTENYEFDKIRTAGVTGNTTNYKNSQSDNPICSTRDENSQSSRPFSSQVATGLGFYDKGSVSSRNLSQVSVSEVTVSTTSLVILQNSAWQLKCQAVLVGS